MSSAIHFSLASRITFLTLIPVLALEFVYAWYNISSTKNNTTIVLLEKGHLISEQLAEASSFYLLSGDFDSIKRLINQAFNRDYIAFISIHNESGLSVAQHSSQKFNPKNTQNYFYFKKKISNHEIYSSDIFEIEDIEKNQQTIGYLNLYMTKESINNATAEAVRFTLLVAIITFFLILLLTHYFSKILTRPILELANHLKNRDKNTQVIELEGSEIGDLQAEFNAISQSLKENRSQLDVKVKSETLKFMEMVKELEAKNQALENSKNEAHRANKIKSNFLANMSHEIRTPINGIKGFISLLTKSQLNPEQSRYTDIINQSCSDLIIIVNEILDFSKIESGKIILQKDSFDLITCIESIRDRFIPAALEKEIDLYLSIFSDVPRQVLGDEARLKQILINLINNAIKFTETGFVQIKVYLEDDMNGVDQQTIKIDILDTGIGINETDKTLLFTAFHQIESSANRRYSGTGLGLVISRRLALLMNGNITLSNKQPNGSIFSLTIPVDSDDTHRPQLNQALEKSVFFLVSGQAESLSEIQSLFTRAQLVTETALVSNELENEATLKSLRLSLKYIHYIVIDGRKLTPQFSQQIMAEFSPHCKIIIINYTPPNTIHKATFLSVSTHSIDLASAIQNTNIVDSPPLPYVEVPSSKKQILIVDDNPINLAFACELLTQWGHKAIKAESALQALKHYKLNTFDLVLMDIQMPEHDGIEAMFMLRKEPSNQGCPIIALTANALAEEETRLLKLGFNGYISKPIDEEALSKIIRHDALAAKTPSPALDKNISIDYEKTLLQTGNKEDLVAHIFQLLKAEIPHYKNNFQKAQKNQDIDLFKRTKHKLEGTACYANMPKLRKILNRATKMAHFENTITEDILKELDLILKMLNEKF